MIGGYTDPAGSRTDFGALLVGYYEGGRLRYAGKVGTGYSAAMLRDLGARLRELETLDVAVRRRAADSARHALDPPRARRPDRLRRVDKRTDGCGSRASSDCATTSPGRGRQGASRLSADRWGRWNAAERDSAPWAPRVHLPCNEGEDDDDVVRQREGRGCWAGKAC